MHVIQARNVAQALPTGLHYLLNRGITEKSRAGDVIVAPGPVTTVYTHPRERVLFSAVRDANPFFHLAEILWMLAGRDDAEFLNHFVADFGERFAEQGGVIHGAYGHRWRHRFGIDQLNHVVGTLRKDPTSRQCVIQMWDASSITLPIDRGHGDVGEQEMGSLDLTGVWRDRPCNTHAYLRVQGGKLDITVCCRSNDIIWGAYGANAVHFSALQEYLAARIGVDVGTYYQVSNNFHAYVDEVRRLTAKTDGSDSLVDWVRDDRYFKLKWMPFPMVSDPETFDADVRWLLGEYETGSDPSVIHFKNTFLSETVWPALMAHRAHKRKDIEVVDEQLGKIEALDWRVACTEWIHRRRK